MVMQHKNLEFDKWLENMQKSTTQGDDIALYVLCRMFNKHAFVHNAMYGWSTMPYRREDSHVDIVAKCDLELVFLKCWAFGEVKKIRGPITTQQSDNTPSSINVIPGNVPIVNVIPGNAARKQTRSSKTPQKKVTERTSARKRPAIDYSKLGDTGDIPSPKKKKRKVNLLRGPSKAVLEAHKRRKKMSPLGASQTKLIPVMTSTSTSNGASTSTGASLGTVTVQASADETKVAIEAVLALGSDMPQPIDDVAMEMQI